MEGLVISGGGGVGELECLGRGHVDVVSGSLLRQHSGSGLARMRDACVAFGTSALFGPQGGYHAWLVSELGGSPTVPRDCEKIPPHAQLDSQVGLLVSSVYIHSVGPLIRVRNLLPTFSWPTDIYVAYS